MKKMLSELKNEKAVAKGLTTSGGMIADDVAPANPKDGDQWFDKTTETLNIWMENDVGGGTWKEMSSTSGGGSGGGASMEISATAPTSPSQGALWFDSTTMNLYTYYDTEWVQTSSSPVSGGSTSVSVSDTAPTDATSGSLWIDSTTMNLYSYFDNNWVQTNSVPTSAGASISVSTQPPANPTQGQVWWDSENANLYVAYDDGTGTQWIQSSSSPVSGSADVAISATAPTSPIAGDLWYDSTNSVLKLWSGSEWITTGSSSSNAAPTISSVSPLSYDGDVNTQITINGTNFTLGAQVTFITSSGTEVDASVVSVLSTTEININTPQNFLVSDGPLDIRVTLPDGQFTSITDAIQTGGSPTWTTTGGTLYQNAWPADVSAGDNSYRLSMSVNETISATDPEGQDITYNIESGSLPPNCSLNTTSGVITGTLPSSLPSDTTYTFTAGATDTAGNKTTRSFNIIVKNTPSVVASPSSVLFTTVGSHTWTVPAGVTSISICCIGGGGGGDGTASQDSGGGGGGGLGYRNLAVTSGETYTVVVGRGGMGNNYDGDDSYFHTINTVSGQGGSSSYAATYEYGGAGGGYTGTGGGSGGTGGNGTLYGGGGGGAAGYSGSGGNGGNGPSGTGSSGQPGQGGGGAGGATGHGGGGGGGVGIYGEGPSGQANSGGGAAGNGGSGGGNGVGSPDTSPFNGGSGGGFGGGGGGGADGDRPISYGGTGAVRVIWGNGRSYPSTNTSNAYNTDPETTI